MKKYLFGLFAIALAIGFSAFTKAHKPTFADTKVFTFTGSTTVSSDVTDRGQWTYLGDLPTVSLCSPDVDKACSFAVDPIYVDNNNQLKNTLTISAANGANISGVQHYIVSGVTATSYSSSQIGNTLIP